MATHVRASAGQGFTNCWGSNQALAAAYGTSSFAEDTNCSGCRGSFSLLWKTGASIAQNGPVEQCCISGSTHATERIGTTTIAKGSGPSLWNLVRPKFSQKATSLTTTIGGHVQ